MNQDWLYNFKEIIIFHIKNEKKEERDNSSVFSWPSAHF